MEIREPSLNVTTFQRCNVATLPGLGHLEFQIRGGRKEWEKRKGDTRRGRRCRVIREIV